ncbi:hypothetical protein QBC47DRAFT_442792 [Echria macrotheca]|uniref:Uncharacterized protein n=1 Tax=Echria macrotheca TaxID=438768 RepID=A0AAJ0BJ08_9PEZI|nr:hypothetical protein QBC47DRAFT_442792 [Echria macrotheca]
MGFRRLLKRIFCCFNSKPEQPTRGCRHCASRSRSEAPLLDEHSAPYGQWYVEERETSSRRFAAGSGGRPPRDIPAPASRTQQRRVRPPTRPPTPRPHLVDPPRQNVHFAREEPPRASENSDAPRRNPSRSSPGSSPTRKLPFPPSPPPGRTSPSTSLTDLLGTIHSVLGHTRYALGGHAALSLHGFPSSSLPEPMTAVTVLCLQPELDILRGWASSAGWDCQRSSTSSSDFIVDSWRVRLKGVDEDEWMRLEREMMVDERVTGVRVVGLPSLLDMFSVAWLRAAGVYPMYSDASGHLVYAAASPQRDTREEREIASILVWIMRRMANNGDAVGWRQAPTATSQEFFAAFTGTYSRVARLLLTVGLGADSKQANMSAWFLVPE